jgi:hypothetical protein
MDDKNGLRKGLPDLSIADIEGIDFVYVICLSIFYRDRVVPVGLTDTPRVF